MKSLIALCFGFLSMVDLSGQGAKYIIQNHDLMNEISLNGSVWCMVQDTNGLLYFGADYGIVRYDGSSWTLISSAQKIVRSLLIDSGHKMFYGGFDDFGVLERNAVSGLAFRSLTGQLPDSLKAFGDIWSINECDGRYFFQSRNRVFILENDSVTSLPVQDTYHRGFIIGNRFTVNQKGTGLTSFDGKAFQLLPGGEFFKKMVISCVIELSQERYLIGSRSHGMYFFNPGTGMVTVPFASNPETNDYLTKNNVYHGLFLPDGTLAIGTLYGGTLIINSSGKILKALNRQHGLRDNANYYLGLSNDYNLWICTSNGISAYNINSPFILWDYTTGIDGVILDIEDFEDKIFVGTLTGLYEIASGKLIREPIGAAGKCLLNSEVWDIKKVQRNEQSFLLFGTGKGLFRLVNEIPVLLRESGIILKVIQLKSNPDIILAMRSEDMDIYHWSDSKLSLLGTVFNLYNGLRTAVEDDHGFLWIGTRNAGVIRVSTSELLRMRFSADLPVDFNSLKADRQNFPFNSVLTDVIDFQGQAVFSNHTGLFQFNYSDRNFERCHLFGPEISNYNKMISALNKDSHGNIWVGGEDIFLYRPDGTYTVDKLNFKQLKDVFSAFVFLHNKDQKTWIGGNNGLYLYDNQLRMKFPPVLQTLITRIVINNDSTLYVNAANPAKLLPEKYSSDKDHPIRINLGKSNSQVTFWFSLPFFDSEKRSLYSYQLEGYSDDWSEWSSATDVTFSNLKPKTYCLKVKSRTVYNQLAQHAEVYFTVPAQWYYSRFAWFLYLISFVMIVYAIAGYITKNRIRKQLRIEDIIQKRIQESKRANIYNTLVPRLSTGDETAGVPSEAPTLAQEGNQFLAKALKTLEVHMADHELTAGRFCQELGMSQARVYRKLISITGMSINEFIRNIRLKKAAQLLLETDYPISEIAYLTGFGSPGYFTKCFKAEFGISPRDFASNRKKE
ncbi:MAG: helix-turn-helix domain-containing protein [Bacteroidales bacterium]